MRATIPYVLRLLALSAIIALALTVSSGEAMSCKYCIKYLAVNAACYDNYVGEGNPPKYSICNPDTETHCRITGICNEIGGEEESVEAFVEDTPVPEG